MSILVVGLSHKSAPITVLERVALDDAGAAKMVHRAVETPHVSECVVVSTCNRVEIYVETERFHGSVEDVTGLLVDHAGLERDAMLPHVYVHYDDAAVAHLFNVASGLDSMVVGESQILGQVRTALQRGQDEATVGPALNVLFQQALRIAKRGHAETDIDRAGTSVVSAAFDQLDGDLAEQRVLVVGAGAMASLSATVASRRGAASVAIANRTEANAVRLAETVGGTVARWDDLDEAIAGADVIVSCTGAIGVVIGVERLRGTVAGRTTPLRVVDLALPRDVEEGADAIDGVELVDLAELAASYLDDRVAGDVRAVRSIVADELTAFLSARNAARVTPAVVALRSMATEIVEAELDRLAGRRPGLDPSLEAEIRQTVRRVADKLLHAPTVRIKELADRPDAASYAEALTDLFALDRSAIEAVTSVDRVEEDGHE